jgi:hypothetical protein
MLATRDTTKIESFDEPIKDVEDALRKIAANTGRSRLPRPKSRGPVHMFLLVARRITQSLNSVGTALPCLEKHTVSPIRRNHDK